MTDLAIIRKALELRNCSACFGSGGNTSAPCWFCDGTGISPASREALSILSRLEAQQAEGWRHSVWWKHVKRGSLCEELGRGFAQVAAHPIEEMTAVVVYQHDGHLWVRNAVEFDDGRFVPAHPPPAKGEGE